MNNENSHKVTITTNGSLANVIIDGKELGCIINNYLIRQSAGEIPEIELNLIATDVKYYSDDCKLKINGIEIEESIEMELFKYLNKKYTIL